MAFFLIHHTLWVGVHHLPLLLSKVFFSKTVCCQIFPPPFVNQVEYSKLLGILWHLQVGETEKECIRQRKMYVSSSGLFSGNCYIGSSSSLICIVLVDASAKIYLQFLVIFIWWILNAIDWAQRIVVIFCLLSPVMYVSDSSVLYFAII